MKTIYSVKDHKLCKILVEDDKKIPWGASTNPLHVLEKHRGFVIEEIKNSTSVVNRYFDSIKQFKENVKSLDSEIDKIKSGTHSLVEPELNMEIKFSTKPPSKWKGKPMGRIMPVMRIINTTTRTIREQNP